MYIKLGRVKVHITFAFALFVAFICSNSAGEMLILTFVSGLLHECIHLCFVLGNGCENAEFILKPGGAVLKCGSVEALGVKNKLLIFLSAPFANILIGALLVLLKKYFNIPENAAKINLSLGFINLLPLSFLDGGRALNTVLEVKYPHNRIKEIENISALLSAVFLAVLTLVIKIYGKNPIGLLFFDVYCFVFALKNGFILKKNNKSGIIKNRNCKDV